MELVTRLDISKFCITPQKITRDGTGTYLYRAKRQDTETYYNGKKVAPAKRDTVYHAGHFFKIKF